VCTFLKVCKRLCLCTAVELLPANTCITGKGTGYRYFGAARNLPGVKELFEAEKPKQVTDLSETSNFDHAW
jgi:hypothetical protein